MLKVFEIALPPRAEARVKASLGTSVVVLLVFIAPAAMYVLSFLRYGRWLIDDALISMAYARSLSEASVLAQTPVDVPVEGVSNITWTMLLAVLRWLGLFDRGGTWLGVEDYVAVVRLLALVAFVAIQLIAASTLRSRCSPFRHRSSPGRLVG